MVAQAQGDARSSLHNVTSKRRISYRESTWKVYRFDIWSVELVCKVVILKVDGALFLWLGSGSSGEPELGELALGVPAGAAGGGGRGGLATALLGEDGRAAALARRLAAWLRRPVYVSSSCGFDRFNAPLIERGLVTEIKNKLEQFNV